MDSISYSKNVLTYGDKSIRLVTEDDLFTVFFEACVNNNLNLLNFLNDTLQINQEDIRAARPYPNQDSDTYYTPLQLVCEYGHLDILHFLKEEWNLGRRDVIGRISISSSSALHLACKNGHLNIIKEFYDSWGITVNDFRDRDGANNGITCLFHACKSGNLELLRFLKECGLTYKDAKITSLGIKKEPQYTLIQWSCQQDNADVLRELKDAWGLDKKDAQIAKNGISILHSACSRGYLNIVRFLIYEWGFTLEDAQIPEESYPHMNALQIAWTALRFSIVLEFKKAWNVTENDFYIDDLGKNVSYYCCTLLKKMRREYFDITSYHGRKIWQFICDMSEKDENAMPVDVNIKAEVR